MQMFEGLGGVPGREGYKGSFNSVSHVVIQTSKCITSRDVIHITFMEKGGKTTY